MTDLNESHNDANEQAQPEEVDVMRITLTKSGEMRVYGNVLADKLAAYGVIENVKDIIREMHKPRIVKPAHGIMDFVRGGRK